MSKPCAIAMAFALSFGGLTAVPAAAATAAAGSSVVEPATPKPRVVITADPELDDNNSMIRYLLRSSDFKTEGLVYASSQFHWAGDGKGTRAWSPRREYDRPGLNICPCTSYRWAKGERFIDDRVEDYAKVYANLKVHDPEYPTPDELRSKIRVGNIEFDGDITRDSPGSELIKSLLLDDDMSPLYLHAWGGGSTIARALLSIQLDYQRTALWGAVRDKVIRKARLHFSGDQDGTLTDYIRPHWPELYLQANAGGARLSYNADAGVMLEEASYFSPEWMQANVSSKGPLGAATRVWGDGRRMVEGDIFDYFHLSGLTAEQLRAQGYFVWTPVHPKGAFLGEGDTGTFLNLLDNGMRGYLPESYGGWGGYRRAASAPTGLFGFPPATGAGPLLRPTTPSPFTVAAMNDLAGRLAWSVTPRFRDANHEPRISATASRTLSVTAGAKIILPISVADPDRNNQVTVTWWEWVEADTYAGAVAVQGDAGAGTLTIPTDAKTGDTIHIIAQATDNGTPALTRYERFVLTVR